MIDYPKAMSAKAQRLHALWLGQDNEAEAKDKMIVVMNALASMYGIEPDDPREQARRFANGDCILCGMTRGERGRDYGHDGNSYCPVECEGYEPVDRKPATEGLCRDE